MKSKFTAEERMKIGKMIYDRDLTLPMAAAKYGINMYTARDYLRMYKASINAVIPVKNRTSREGRSYENMSRNELMDELMALKKRLDEKEGSEDKITTRT